MKRFVFFFTTLLFNSFSVLSQTDYKSDKYVGPQDYTANIRPNAKLVLKGPANDTLTEWQSIPFDFYFFGKKVDGYYISEDGYITFSKDANKSKYKNQAIPTVEEPNNAIYGYWENLKLENVMTMWSNEIRSITLGEPTDRFHVIMWISAIPENETFSTAGLSFAVVLMEKNSDINIVYVAGRKNTTLNGLIGIENEDGSKGLMLENSPNFDFPSLTSVAADDITYTISENSLSKEYEVVTNKNLNLYPNPAKDIVHITLKSDDYIESIFIYSLNGKKLTEINSHINNINIDFSDYQKGIYLLRITLSNGKELFKTLIKE
ncbi:MAG: T9SS type A sorting domain-containing protein [Candidatus Kapabacteria bacterium]|nr:T9SS type A sorting domain-containing protein [Candidatus Kapabacteria bacterium]